MRYSNRKNPVFALFIFALFFFLRCVSFNPFAAPAPTPVPTQVPTPGPVVKEEKDPGVEMIENELIMAEDYLNRTNEYIAEMAELVSLLLPEVNACKGPVNMMEPFIFVDPTVPPRIMLFRRYSIEPCRHYIYDSYIASGNAGARMEYVLSMLEEVKSTATLVERSCKNNGMSGPYKALVTSGLQGYLDRSRNELGKIYTDVEDLKGLLRHYKNCP